MLKESEFDSRLRPNNFSRGMFPTVQLGSLLSVMLPSKGKYRPVEALTCRCFLWSFCQRNISLFQLVRDLEVPGAAHTAVAIAEILNPAGLGCFLVDKKDNLLVNGRKSYLRSRLCASWEETPEEKRKKKRL